MTVARRWILVHTAERWNEGKMSQLEGSSKNWHVEWSDHTPLVQMPKHKNSIMVAAHVINWAVDVGARLMTFENGLWHMEGRRTQRRITGAAAHIRFSCCLFFFWQKTNSHTRSHSLSLLIFIFSQERWFWPQMWRGKTRGQKERGCGWGNSCGESENVGSLSAFLSGCCSEAAG